MTGILWVFRVLLLLICTEGAVRYLIWTLQIRSSPSPGAASLIIPSIAFFCLGMTWFFAITFYALMFPIPSDLRAALTILADTALIAGAGMALVVYWRVSRALSERQISIAIAWRIAVAVIAVMIAVVVW